MKRIYFIIPLFLAGCSVFTPSKYDFTFFDRAAQLSIDVESALPKCGMADMQTAVSALNHDSKVLVKYTTYADTDLAGPVQLTDKAISELYSVYSKGTPSPAYCELKLKIIALDLQEILKAAGGKDK